MKGFLVALWLQMAAVSVLQARYGHALVGVGVRDTFFLELPSRNVRQLDVLPDANSTVLYIDSALDNLNVMNNDWIYGSFVSCYESAQPPMSEAETELAPQPLQFNEVSQVVGINHVHRKNHPARPDCSLPIVAENPVTNLTARLDGELCQADLSTGAVVAGDYDNDGHVDLYFTVHSGPSRLYRNKGDGTFEDVSVRTRIGPKKFASGAVFVDVDDDGDLDLYVTTLGDTRHYLYINHHGGLFFTEEAEMRGVSLRRPDGRVLSGMTPSAGDYDRDGFPDIYVTEWLYSYVAQPAASLLLHNRGSRMAGYFEDATQSAGLASAIGSSSQRGTFTFCSSFTDMDNDGWQDLIITGDFGTSKVFWNNQNGTFTECTEACGITVSPDAMGHAIGDWNIDGVMDWWMTAIHDQSDFDCKSAGCKFSTAGNIFYANQGNRRLQDLTTHVGIRKGFWGWGNSMVDFNNDRWLDFIMTNGFDDAAATTDDRFRDQPMRLWENLGPEKGGKTIESSSKYNIDSTHSGRGLIKVDYDNDGDEDIIVASNVGHPAVFRNDGGNRNNWIKVKVMRRCTDMVRQCHVLGSRVQVTSQDGITQTQEIGSGSHFMAQNELTAHFGLGASQSDVTIKVTFPNQFSDTTYTNVSVNRLVRIMAPPSFFSHTTLPYSNLDQCQNAIIVNVTQPEIGSTHVNPGGRSIKYDVDGEELLERLEDPANRNEIKFSYKIALHPPHTSEKAAPSLSGNVVMYYINAATMGTRTECARDGNNIGNAPQPDIGARPFNAHSNNLDNTLWGSSSRVLRRDFPSAYSDGIDSPAGQCPHATSAAISESPAQSRCPFSNDFLGSGSTRPSPRSISNAIFAQDHSLYTELGLNDLHTQYGQFIAHDLDFTSPLPTTDPGPTRTGLWLPIPVPKGDLTFDVYDEGGKYLPFTRSIFQQSCSGKELSRSREQVNKITSVIDGNMVYGSSKERNSFLRSHVGGEMLVQSTPHGDMLPLNNFSISNDNPVGRKGDKLLVAGDTRCNVQPGLMALHTLFVREHNRLCRRYRAAHPNASDEEVFQYARRIVIAELQAITYREYLPAIFGRDVPAYTGYKADVQPEVSNVFATASFRFGHSQVNTHLWRLTEDGWVAKGGHLLLREAYFAPERLLRNGGMEPLLLGSIFQRAQKVDSKMIDEMRNLLFPRDHRNRHPGMDLASLNIQRGRDHGLPDYNTVREGLGLPRVASFDEISHDPQVVAALSSVYPTVDDIDVWVGGLAEDKMHRESAVGPTFYRNLMSNFLRVRDGDRYWYENIMTRQEIEEVESMTMLEVIRKNSDVKAPRARHSFYSPSHCRAVVNHRCRRVMLQTSAEEDVSTPAPPSHTSAPPAQYLPPIHRACQENAVTKRTLKRAIRKRQTVLIGGLQGVVFNGSSDIDVVLRLQSTYSLEPQGLYRVGDTVTTPWPVHRCHCIPVQTRGYVAIANQRGIRTVYAVTNDYQSDLVEAFLAWLEPFRQKALSTSP
ncbi:uncharacterized protein LOC135831094 [Sycon ciliatum]|uniref:uncharacterized protein LOC135831094 n=1 Tax=Sycon ciliatum TaxID=27933 RepID=UPI0031F63435